MPPSRPPKPLPWSPMSPSTENHYPPMLANHLVGILVGEVNKQKALSTRIAYHFSPVFFVLHDASKRELLQTSTCVVCTKKVLAEGTLGDARRAKSSKGQVGDFVQEQTWVLVNEYEDIVPALLW
eukprot:CAMPEP_0171802878 /NCGR_PEP_ID=MMETSP0991-20121206/73133_1 /TAXON_ID=483369 /ORGANISM="non described non described, Strain CCMP2098" /LENGTH=124 /DNA_ID=CAMNT_0012414855 /DNA_START=219 /DNA_END=590 /DNA_ORIENTATION=+